MQRAGEVIQLDRAYWNMRRSICLIDLPMLRSSMLPFALDLPLPFLDALWLLECLFLSFSSSMPSGQGHISLALVSQSQQPFNLITRLSLQKRLLSSCCGLQGWRAWKQRTPKIVFLKRGRVGNIFPTPPALHHNSLWKTFQTESEFERGTLTLLSDKSEWKWKVLTFSYF